MVNDPCAICGKCTDPEFGPELFMSDSWELVCYEYGDKYALELVQMIGDYRASERFG